MILISWDHKKLISWERENTVSEPYQYKEGIISRIITEEFERRLEFKRRMKMNLEILTVEESDKRKLMSVIPAHGEKFLFMAKMKLEDLKISYPKAEFYLVYDGKYYSVRGNDIFQEYMNVEYEKEKLKNIRNMSVSFVALIVNW